MLIRLKKNDTLEKLFMLQIINAFMMNATTIFQTARLTSFFFVCTFLVTALIFVIQILWGNEKQSKDVIISIATIALALFSIIYTCRGINFEYIKKWIVFASCIIYIYCVSNMQINAEKVLKIVLAFPVLFNFTYYVLKIRSTYGTTDWLTMNYTNPNLLGMWIAISMIFTAMGYFQFKRKGLRLFCVINFILLVPILMESNSRNSIIPVLAFFILYLTLKNKRHVSFITNVMLWMPIIFVAGYLICIPLLSKIGIFQFMISAGKDLDSRVGIWSRCLEILQQYPLTGNYFVVKNGTGVSQCLNTHLDILCSYGVVVYILMMHLLNTSFKKSVKKNDNKFNAIYVGSIAITLVGIGEAALFSGGIGIYILAFIGLALKPSNEEVNRK